MPLGEKEKHADIDFHGAAIVDEKGNEVEITEEMVRSAIDTLESEVSSNEEES